MAAKTTSISTSGIAHKWGYILTIILAAILLVGFLFSSNLTDDGESALALFAGLLILIIIGSIGGIMNKKWGKYLTIGLLSVVAFISLFGPGGMVIVIPSVILIGAILFSK